MGFIQALIVSDIIGAIAEATMNKGSSMGIIINVIVDLVGSTIRQASLGTWGLAVVGMAIIPSLIGTIILVLVVSFFTCRL